MVTDAHLLYLNHHGLIPGPDESEEAFMERAERCLHLGHEVTQVLDDHIPFNASELAPEHILKNPLLETQSFYDTTPDWIPIFFSNKGLAPWHGGCAWIGSTHADRSPIAFFQLRRAFTTCERYLGLYGRDELVTHELSHVGRMMFQEPHYEELLAYSSSPSRFRRFFGPLLTSARETLLFVGVILLVLFVDLAAITQPSQGLWKTMLWLKLIPIAMIVYAIGRLWVRQRRFCQCQSNLKELFAQDTLVGGVIYRLTDHEITLFSRLKPRDILHYANDQGKHSLRWRVLLLAYFAKAKWKPET